MRGSFSAVSKPIFASKYSLDSSRRDLHNALLCTVLEPFSNLKIDHVILFDENVRNYIQLLGKKNRSPVVLGSRGRPSFFGCSVLGPVLTTADRQNFGKMLLVFGWIGADLCKQIRVLQHFSKSTRLYQIIWLNIFKIWQNFTDFATLAKMLLHFHKNC